ncbi:MAG: cytochrome c, partial [Chloroflexi bacterium]|nr:cytochrome c [Chloroflexota bacterium]
MSKRMWIILLVSIGLALLVGACGSNDLADDLTPVPYVPEGEEPTLRAELRDGVPPVEPAEDAPPADDDDMDDMEDGEDGADTQLVANGEALFNNNGCAGCHMAEAGAFPALTGMGERAQARADEGVSDSAEEYLVTAIV